MPLNNMIDFPATIGSYTLVTALTQANWIATEVAMPIRLFPDFPKLRFSQVILQTERSELTKSKLDHLYSSEARSHYFLSDAVRPTGPNRPVHARTSKMSSHCRNALRQPIPQATVI